MNGINASTKIYENWLQREIGDDFFADDLEVKHKKMRASPFSFLRATYWRWAEIIFEICPDLTGAPRVLAIGDIHLENFGTWRDIDGRLIWGVNDFDDAAVMPYPLDLIRLACSTFLIRRDSNPSTHDICHAIHKGYTEGLANPSPVVLERDYDWLRRILLLSERERTKFWEKIARLVPMAAPAPYEHALHAAMPEPDRPLTIFPRSAGTGSLGRPRFLASCDWRGGPVLREAKALVVSGWSIRHAPADKTIRAGEIATGRFRAPDPHLRLADRIVVRRLSPNSRKIEVKDAADELLSLQMLELMGREIANCHADDPSRLSQLREDVAGRKNGWLHTPAKIAAERIVHDQAEYVA
ncbi:DUF2252 domain-containing protein [Oleomonas cavernae]|uniref:DUF2252 domain-containing protein n=1 Tax=Oleomonas cavernae TaxID=2320859 RepID=A0A418WH80_9PROT|nr:DUF2252 family protein [Oleomonas cavernae]RJF89338.1 DUF2252 domain-containing protein [Oleomonas cavernae]